ncbi:MAG: hypothetical protein PHF24_06825 [Syntrophomonas sp.]|nr:hypothetical protein [Syntrophomonas sp.]
MVNVDLVRFLKINNDTVLNFISKAKERIIFAKPAFLNSEIEALLKAKQKHNIEIDIYMEPGDKAIRLGFGEKAALNLINTHLSWFNIQFAERIRMAILCFDNNALLYAPNLSFSEPETPKPTFANGILCNGSMASIIIKQFPVLGNTEPSNKKARDNVLMLPGGYIPDETINKLQDNIHTTITSTIENLTVNPAVDPSQLQKISIYRNNYKIVRQVINGIKIENKRISLKPFYNLLQSKVDRLQSSWSIFNSEDIDALQDTKSFWRQLRILEDKYSDSLLDAGRFGKLLNVNKKAEYVKDITNLKEDFKAFWGAKPSQEVKERFSIKGKINEKKFLKDILDTSRKGLEEYLISLCPYTDEFLENIFRHNRQLRNTYRNYGDKGVIIEEFVNIFVLNILKFPDANDIINTIDIKIDFYDISDELLTSEDFLKVIENYELNLRQTSLGFEPVNTSQQSLF